MKQVQTRYVYAIYPKDANGDIAGVYVGSTEDVKKRISEHLSKISNTNERERRKHRNDVLPERIKEARLRRGLTIKQMAEAIGVSEPTACKYENAQITNITYTTVKDIADCLGVSYGWLLGETDFDSQTRELNLSTLMRDNGFTYQILGSDPRNSSGFVDVKCVLEYQWIQFFKKHTDLYLFNKQLGPDNLPLPLNNGCTPAFIRSGVYWEIPKIKGDKTNV